MAETLDSVKQSILDNAKRLLESPESFQNGEDSIREQSLRDLGALAKMLSSDEVQALLSPSTPAATFSSLR